MTKNELCSDLLPIKAGLLRRLSEPRPPLQERQSNYSDFWSFVYFVYCVVTNDHAERGPAHRSAERSWEPFLHFFCAILHLFLRFAWNRPLQINDLRKKLHHRHFGVRRRVAAVRSSRGRFCGLSRISWFQLLFPGSELASHLEHPPRRDARRGRRAACPTTALLRI